MTREVIPSEVEGSARTLRAFLLAPLAAPVAYAVTLLLGTLVGRGATPSMRSAFDIVLAVFAAGVPLAYAAALVAGGPVYLLLRRLGLVRRWTLWPAGAAIGTTVALLIAPSLRGDLFSIRFPWWAGALLGVVSAEAFLRLLAPPAKGDQAMWRG
jgi:hypothetical protein